ncbi:MAG TPA: DUF4383 domain-containing protein [Solirubrobacteraceae bacterium]
MGSITEGKSVGQLAALAIGVAYSAGAVAGFCVTGFSDVTASHDKTMLGLTLNPFQDFFHLFVGGLLLIAALKWTTVTCEGLLLGVGAIYIIAAITGFTYAHIPVITIVTAGNLDNYLHLVTGLTAIAGSLLSTSITNSKGRATATS